MLIDILRGLQKTMNFTLEIKITPDGRWGALEADGKTWNGVLGALERDEVDMERS